ncbi:MAG: phospholipid carrier-dependent glycosyltransferase [Clostridiales bacterium]
MKKIILLVVTFVLIISCSLPVMCETETVKEDIKDDINIEETNLLSNPGFEKLSNKDPQFWKSFGWFTEEETEYGVDNNVSRSGKSSAYVNNLKENHSRYTQEIIVEENQIYKISGFIKTQNIGTENDGAAIFIEKSSAKTRTITGTTKDWEYVELYGKTADGQKVLNISLTVGGYASLNTGKAWFDDVKLEKVNEQSVVDNVKSLDTDLDPNRSKVEEKSFNKLIPILIIGFILIICSIVLFLALFMRKKTDGKLNENQEETKVLLDLNRTKIKFDRKDIYIMLIVTLVYFIIALYKLGSLSVPTTYWTPTMMNENFTISFDKETTISRISTYSGLGSDREAEGRFIVDYMDKSGDYKYLVTIEKKHIFILEHVNIPETETKKLRFTVEEAGGSINEFAIYEKGKTTPIKDINIEDYNIKEDKDELNNLFDEQDKMDYLSNYYNSMYFDEIYHGRTAFEFIHKIIPYENTHPPLGKVIMALGILIFGMVPFGWRIAGTLIGVAMVPVMYMFGKKMFGKRIYGFAAMIMMTFDFMHFAQTRIATIDSYVTLFVILMYYYIYDYFMEKSYVIGFKASLKPLLLSGLFFGLGAASKWIALYGAAGLALVFFIAQFNQYMDYREISKNSENIETNNWTKYFYKIYMFRTYLFCCLFFIVIPIIIYYISYIPWMIMPDENLTLTLPWNNSIDMYKYHSELEATHSFQSDWWEWPIMSKPMAFYFGENLPINIVSKIFTMGNPAIWWTGIIAFIVGIPVAIMNKEKKMLVPYIAIFWQYIPWVVIPRCAFIYHFFTIVPFLILIIVYLLKELYEKIPNGKILFYSYLVLIVILFILFYPVISGMEVSQDYTKLLKWFDNWDL